MTREEAIRAWTAANEQARRDYYRHLNAIEAHDPSICIDDDCDDYRVPHHTRCNTHVIRARRDRNREYRLRNPGDAAVRQQRHRERKKAQR